MDKNKIIIILALILIALAILTVALINPTLAKEDTKVIITSNSTLKNGDNITIHLTNLNNTPIADQVLTISIVDENGSEINQSIKTDYNGDGNLQLNGLTPNNYTLKVYYGGNENFTNSNTTQNLNIIEEVVKSTPSPTVSNNHQESGYYGPDVDSSGVTREQAREYGWTYTPEHGGHYIGSHDRWDENAGMYHD